LAQAHGGQPGCVYSTTLGCGMERRLPDRAPGVRKFHAYSIAVVIRAVFLSMAETEQYFSSESRTASSMALCSTGPLTR